LAHPIAVKGGIRVNQPCPDGEEIGFENPADILFRLLQGIGDYY